MNNELIIIGDRVLIKPDADGERTDTGLYLPQGVKEKEKVQSGIVVKTGPGYPMPDPSALEIEPWQTPKFENKYFPLQVKEGDHCVFLRNAGIDVEFEGKKYIVVPHSAVLILMRNQ
ncbi:MAG: co-chaperone GroES family protein [Candidatus Omnitrophota bacterium]